MQAEYVCRKTEAFGWGGRVAVGHVTQMSLVPPARFAALAATLARAGVAVTVLPATDLYLMGRTHDHAVPRGVVAAEPLRAAGVVCSIATNNVLNPFTPYGDANLLRMANLYANVCHVARPQDLAGCLDMVTHAAARLMRVAEYGVRVGAPADLVLFDAAGAAACGGGAGAAAMGHEGRPPDVHAGARPAAPAGLGRVRRLRFSRQAARWWAVRSASVTPAVNRSAMVSMAASVAM